MVMRLFGYAIIIDKGFIEDFRWLQKSMDWN
jgi:hypothetical protein